MEPNTENPNTENPNAESGANAEGVWIRAGAALSAWEKQQAAREFQRQVDHAAYTGAALRELRAGRVTRRKERREGIITWLIFAAVAVVVIWGICIGGIE